LAVATAGPVRERRTVTVLLAHLAPIVQRGLAELLADAGADWVAGDRRILAHARRVRPDVVVLGTGRGPARDLAGRICAALPDTKVILWPRDEERMEILSSGCAARLEPARAESLLSELRDA
jgi:hypothetical protein